MRPTATHWVPLALAMICATLTTADCRAADPAPGDGWVNLIDGDGPHGWKDVPKGWAVVGSTHLSAGNLKTLAAASGKGVLYNGPTGRAGNLVTAAKFGDVEAHVEFLVPAGSNSGVKFEGVYEVQIFDSYGVKTATASHSGGVYPRAELLPNYHHIDDGYPPLVNAAKPPGEWQTLDVVFHAPKFARDGKKSAHARFVKVVLNGRLVQDDREVPSPTGHAWHGEEVPTGPLLLQGDHGPVAFRNVRVRPIND